MTSLQIVLSNNTTDFKTDFNPSLHLNSPCEIALINLETYYSIPNIKPGYNALRVIQGDFNAGGSIYDVALKTGSFSLVDINKKIEARLEEANFKDANNQYAVKFSADINTFKTIMTILPGYSVDFVDNSLNRILGFEPKKYDAGTHESEKDINILPVNSILVNLDIIEGSYVKGEKGNTIYSFFPNVNPGHKILERPPYPLYSPLLLNDIHSIRMTLTDQNGDLIDLRGENITVRFHIRNIKSY